jgi:tetratricopeptide (TPR) repeat protein
MERVMAEVERFAQTSMFESLNEANAALHRRFSGPIDELPSTATTPLEKAQDLMYRAFEARGRRRIQLARKALELSADCADAYVMLAEEGRHPEEARTLYEAGVAAGERALGPDLFAQEAGHFWGIVWTRPYMRARFGLARCLEALDRRKEAIEHYRELLRLNPGDNQGVRYSLLAALLLGARCGSRHAPRPVRRRADRALALRPRPLGFPARGRQPCRARAPARGAPDQPPRAAVPLG